MRKKLFPWSPLPALNVGGIAPIVSLDKSAPFVCEPITLADEDGHLCPRRLHDSSSQATMVSHCGMVFRSRSTISDCILQRPFNSGGAMKHILLRSLVGGMTGSYVAFIMMFFFPQTPMLVMGIPVVACSMITAYLFNRYVK